MTFFGGKFVFNSIPCEAYDLMMYEIGSSKQSSSDFASIPIIEEEYVAKRWKPYFYGVRFEDKLEVRLVFGVNQRRIDEGKYLDRFEISEIASWLTGHDQYMWLEIEQPDMRHVRYKCICSGLSIVTYEQIPWSLEATFICDGPYAYSYPQTFSYTVDGTSTVNLFNDSGLNGYYYPEMVIHQEGGTFSIVNSSDDNRTFSLTDYPAAASTVYVDNDHCVITNSADLNLYPYFNKKFFRLKRGGNVLIISGSGTVDITCSFPINVGG